MINGISYRSLEPMNK